MSLKVSTCLLASVCVSARVYVCVAEEMPAAAQGVVNARLRPRLVLQFPSPFRSSEAAAVPRRATTATTTPRPSDVTSNPPNLSASPRSATSGPRLNFGHNLGQTFHHRQRACHRQHHLHATDYCY
ncbi:hypothetical protein E2C01_001596 [Portunus trituberculatus]|uniref:Secreted protein n=1 Tax=Portunus trituberculatus TaxID=210409 RepID=A0A5B7CID4_PORTR|nr:hypothetical protein [Portunus trituberculatus]